MLEKIKYLNKNDLKSLLLIISIDSVTFKPSIKYFDLYYYCENTKDEHIYVEHVINNLVYDASKMYFILKNKLQNIKCNELQEHEYEVMDIIKSFINVFEKMMLKNSFDDVRIKNIQKTFLEQKLDEEIKKENYELCIEIKNKIDIISN